MHNTPLEPSILASMSTKTQDAQKGCPARPQRVKTGGGTDRTSWGRSHVQWILANGKTPPVFARSENFNRYVEDLNEVRTSLADFFSILLDLSHRPSQATLPSFREALNVSNFSAGDTEHCGRLTEQGQCEANLVIRARLAGKTKRKRVRCPRFSELRTPTFPVCLKLRTQNSELRTSLPVPLYPFTPSLPPPLPL